MPPGRWSAAEQNFLATPYYSQHEVFASLSVLFHYENYYLIIIIIIIFHYSVWDYLSISLVLYTSYNRSSYEAANIMHIILPWSSSSGGGS